MQDEMHGTVFRIGPAHGGWRLDRFLSHRIPRLSRTVLQRAIGERVRIDRIPNPRPSTRLRPGDRVLVGFPPVEEDPERLRRLAVPVLHDDDHVVVVDKPAGMVVHPTNGVRRASLIEILRSRHPGGAGLRLAHRLDRETSGVLLLARSSGVARELHEAFRAGRIRKRYLAVVAPPLAAGSGARGVIDLPVGLVTGGRVPLKRRVDRSGSPARTVWTVRGQFPGATLLEVEPATGRQHQIRVHLQALGHPVVGDKLYGTDELLYLRHVRGEPDEEDEARLGAPRQLLHALELRFPRPGGGGDLTVRAPVPGDMRSFLAGRGSAPDGGERGGGARSAAGENPRAA